MTLRSGKPHLTSTGKPVADVPTPPYGQFWVVSVAAAATEERRRKHEQLAQASFARSLRRQNRRPVDHPETSWVGCRLSPPSTVRPDVTPLVTDLQACEPGVVPTWWILAVHARTVARS